ncbi:MAG: hypothetical protein IKZ84_02670, partial [Victivallales bacterium]|nr:hypothetical protein [Victivallales bacterium]
FCRVLRMAEKDEALRGAVRRHFPAFDGSCTALPDDRVTLGDWQMHYGNRFYVLAAMGQVRDWIGSGKRKPLRYSVKVPTDRDIARYWLPKRQRDLSSPDALLRPAGYKNVLSTEKTFPDMKGIFPLLTDKKIRRASWWDDHGEMHPFDDEGPDLIIRADLDSARSCVSLYMMDYDWRMSSHPRQQSVIVHDSKGMFLNACWEGKIDHGVYARFRTSGISEMAFRICKHRGNCTAVSGLFVDVPPSKPISPMDVQRQESKATPDVLKVILDAEADFCWEKAMNVFTQELQEMKSPDELGRLLESLASMEDLHPCWLFLSAAKAFETAEKIDTQGKIELLAVILEKCEAHVHYPLRAHALRLWKEYGLPEEHSAVVRYKPIPINKTDTETQKGEQP